MKSCWIKTAFLIFLAVAVNGGPVSFAQQPAARSQEISEVDGQPVLLKHLPDHERVSPGAAFVTDKGELKSIVGAEAVLDVLEFSVGTEAVTAIYPEGRLVIVEYANPQLSAEVDTRIQQYMAASPQSPFVYRRIGNYNAFVFSPSSSDRANTLLDGIKYEKTVQWLGEDPYLLKKLERYMVSTSRDIMISTVLWILLGLGVALLTGIAAGFIFFSIREQKRANRTAYSDAGGLTRLNLDGLSE
jgi:hypothetical protein